MTSQDKKKTRKPNWSGPDGRDSTITCLKTTLEPHFSELLSDDGKPYTSKDMQKGINTSQLSKFIVMLTSLMELDPRGGFFGQADVNDSFQAVELSKNLENEFKRCAKARKVTMQVLSQQISYYIRVMLSH